MHAHVHAISKIGVCIHENIHMERKCIVCRCIVSALLYEADGHQLECDALIKSSLKMCSTEPAESEIEKGWGGK